MTPEEYARDWLDANAVAVLRRTFGRLGVALLAKRLPNLPNGAEWWECQPDMTYSADGMLLHILHFHLPPGAREPGFDPWPMFLYHRSLHRYGQYRPDLSHYHAPMPIKESQP